MRSIFILTCILTLTTNAFAQKWYDGHFTDIKGNREDGLIDPFPSGRGPVKDEGFIAFKADKKTNPFKLSAGEIQSFVNGRDSFVVAHAPGNSEWSNHELDFVKVVIDGPTKLYVSRGGVLKGGHGGGFNVSPTVSTGFGTGGGYYGGGLGGGVSVPITIGGGSSGKTNQKLTFYYGENTAGMKEVTPDNFNDVMMDIMGDEPDLVEAIRQNQYNLGNVNKLLERFDKLQQSHK